MEEVVSGMKKRLWHV